MELTEAAGGEIEDAGLVAANDARRFRARAGQGHRNASGAREVAPARNGDKHWEIGHAIEGFRRHYQHRAPTLLFVPRCRIGTNEPNLAAFH